MIEENFNIRESTKNELFVILSAAWPEAGAAKDPENLLDRMRGKILS